MVDILLSDDIYSVQLYLERTSGVPRGFRRRAKIICIFVFFTQISIAVTAFRFQSRKTHDATQDYICPYFALFREQCEYQPSEACKKAPHASAWAGIFSIISMLSLTPDLIPKWTLKGKGLQGLVFCFMQPFAGLLTFAVSSLVARGSLDFMDMAMNFAALSLIAQLDDSVLQAARHFFGMEFARIIPDGQSKSLTVQITRDEANRYKDCVSCCAWIWWIIAIVNAIRLNCIACGQPIFH